MIDAIKKYFENLNIEYYCVLSYADCIENKQNIMAREGFCPKSVIVYLLPYYVGDGENISRYAVSLDYHIAIKEIGEGLCKTISQAFAGAKVKSYGDHSPIDERHAALVGGLGISGMNGLLINEKYGSYVFIGDVVTDLSPELLGATKLGEIGACEKCGACLDACPTGILRGEGEGCLSAITQRKGELSRDEKNLMGAYHTAWGCDICQSSCPHNAKPAITPIEFFHRENIFSLTKETLEKMSDEEFSRRAYAWRKRCTVERNLEILAEYDN